MKWIVLVAVVVVLAGCVAFVTPASTFQFGGHANAAANTGEAGLQRQADPGMPAGEMDASYGLGYVKAKQTPASQPTTRPTKPDQ